jgi:regulator of protease activity HflC (stomatin/prohibitin superfamily)
MTVLQTAAPRTPKKNALRYIFSIQGKYDNVALASQIKTLYSYTQNCMYGFILLPLIVLFLATLRQVNQYERGIKFTMGRYSGMVEPGWRVVVPIFQSMTKVDLRIKTLDVPSQDAITKDNVSAKVTAVIYYKISDATKSIIEVESVHYAVSQLAQTTMRNVVGEVTLDELLSQRAVISEKIEKQVDVATLSWGVEVVSVELKDINLPPDMIRTIAKQAEAERERRAVIINAEGELAAAENLSKAARMLAETPGALHLRTLNSINDISSDASNTVVFTLPLEILQAISGYKK